MKLTSIIRITTVATAITAASTASAGFHKREIRLEDAPRPVQAAIREHSRGGELDEIETIRFDGRTIFAAEIELPGDRDLDLYFDEDGTLTKTVEEIGLSEAPEAVRASVESAIPAHGKLDDIDKVTTGGTVTFRVEIDRPGPDLHLVVSPAGEILEREDEADD